MSFNISNLANIVFSTNKTSEVKKTSETKQEFKVPVQNQEIPSQATTKQLNAIYNQVVKTTTHVMTNIQQNIFLRDILGLPKEWSALLSEFVVNDDNAELIAILKNLSSSKENQISLMKLLEGNSKVDLNAIAELLNKNSALVSDKLLKYMGTSHMSQMSISQLKNIMLIGASIAASAQINPNDFLRNIMQMYVPYLPLVPPKEEDLREIEGSFSSNESKNSNVTFYLSTHFLGYFKIEILLGETNEIYITNISDIDNKNLKEDLCSYLVEDIKKTSIKAKLFFSKKTDNDNINLKGKQLYIITSTDSIIGLTLIQLLSKTIFKFDETQAQRYIKSENLY